MYKIIFDGYEEDDLYDTYNEAEEAALEMQSNWYAGASDLYQSNPGDYEEDYGDDSPDYEIVEV